MVIDEGEVPFDARELETFPAGDSAGSKRFEKEGLSTCSQVNAVDLKIAAGLLRNESGRVVFQPGSFRNVKTLAQLRTARRHGVDTAGAGGADMQTSAAF